MYSPTVTCSIFLYSFYQLNIIRSDVAGAPADSIKRYVSNDSITYFVKTDEGCECLNFWDCQESEIFPIPDQLGICPGPIEVCCKVTMSTILEAVGALDDYETTTRSFIEAKPSSTYTGDNGLESTTKSVPSLRKCGERYSTPEEQMMRVAGSPFTTNTGFSEFPFMASIWAHKRDFVCGASLISSNMLLTAAKCVHKYVENCSALSVRVGDYDVTANTYEEKAPHLEKTVSEVVIHPNFKLQYLKNDLAIIVTADAFKFDDHIFPVCTVAYDREFANSNAYNESACLATGWGKPSKAATEKLSSTLKKADLAVVPLHECEKELKKDGTFNRFFELDSNYICARGIDGSNTCKGDGGGPLVCPLFSDSRQYVQIGVTSWGKGCGGDDLGLYASLQPCNDWILSVYEKYKLYHLEKKN